MSYITHPDAPDKDRASRNAEELAENLSCVYEGYQVRIVECLHSRFEVRVEVPFRAEHLTWAEQEQAREAGHSS